MELINKVRSDIAIWNINSYGEYFLQIATLFKNDYINSCNKIATVREKFINDLKEISKIKVYDSEANYVLCNLNDNDSTEIAIKLLEKNIFIKDLKTKDAFKNMNYIRLAVRTEEENNILVNELKSLIK